MTITVTHRTQIIEHHQKAQAAAQTALEHALAAGKLLLEVKESLPHGGWLPFLADVGIHQRQGQRYLSLARHAPLLANTTPCRISISDALDRISAVRALDAGHGLYFDTRQPGSSTTGVMAWLEPREQPGYWYAGGIDFDTGNMTWTRRGIGPNAERAWMMFSITTCADLGVTNPETIIQIIRNPGPSPYAGYMLFGEPAETVGGQTLQRTQTTGALPTPPRQEKQP